MALLPADDTGASGLLLQQAVVVLAVSASAVAISMAASVSGVVPNRLSAPRTVERARSGMASTDENP